jgi:hypothetical protein
MNKKKTKEIIKYILQECGSMSKKKLCNLLYFIDFDFFEKYEKKLTGIIYKK